MNNQYPQIAVRVMNPKPSAVCHDCQTIKSSPFLRVSIKRGLGCSFEVYKFCSDCVKNSRFAITLTDETLEDLAQ